MEKLRADYLAQHGTNNILFSDSDSEDNDDLQIDVVGDAENCSEYGFKNDGHNSTSLNGTEFLENKNLNSPLSEVEIKKEKQLSCDILNLKSNDINEHVNNENNKNIKRLNSFSIESLLNDKT